MTRLDKTRTSLQYHVSAKESVHVIIFTIELTNKCSVIDHV